MKKIFLPLCIIFIVLFQNSVSAQRDRIDSLLNVLKICTEDSSKMNTLNLLCRQYINVGNYEQAMQYAHKAQQQSRNINYQKGIADSYNNLGIIYWYHGDYEKALDNYLNALKIRQEIGDKKGMGSSYGNIGNIYEQQGNYEKALDNYLKALKIQEEAGDKNGIPNSYNNIGGIYFSHGNYEKALDSFLKCLKIFEELGNARGVAVSYNNIGDIYRRQGKFEKALDNYLKSLKISEEIKFKQLIASSYGNIGLVYSDQGNYGKALDNYFNCLKISEETADKRGIGLTMVNIGVAYLKLDKYEEAYNYLSQSLILFKEIGNKNGIKDVYSSLSDLYDKKGDYKQAFQYHKLYADIKDTILNEQSSKQIAEMATKYDSGQKDKAIQLLNKDKERQESIAVEEKRRQRIILFSVLGFSFLVILFAIFIYRSFRQKQRLNTELEKLSIVASETDNGVLICGSKGEIEWCNAGFTHILGYTVEDLKRKGNTLEEISTSPEIKSLIHQSIENKKPSTYQALNITKDGKRRWMQSTLTPILDKQGNIKKLVVIDMDVTQRKQADDEIKQKNQNITDSINYAKRIQQAILPSDEIIKSCIPDSFIFLKPKNIVSGDFYWMHAINKQEVLLAAVDCTGHGVPGALMSMMGYNLLQQIVKEHHIYEPAMILNELSSLVIESLRQTDASDPVKDGMDISICKINYQTYELEYAGAHNPLYLIRKGILIEAKADRKSVGFSAAKSCSFSNHKIKLEKEDCLYLFSDGYADQKGGPHNEKIFYQPFRDLLMRIHQLPMKQQMQQLEKVFFEWKGEQEQIDDILVISVRI